ncbi:glycosyltransferase family 1 protein, partial [Prochlorococcus sp. AH-716-O13]|nr:glycosyltransferase family 1 protein [Prochlorococcus sp. AH-716-O13]
CLYDPDEKDNGEKSLIEATKKILADKNKKEAMRDEARKEAEQWDWNQATLQLQKYYLETLENIS